MSEVLTEAEEPTPSYPTGMSAIRKATRVMRALTGGPLPPSELARKLGEPVPTVYRMLSNLESIGWVERQRGKGGQVRLGVDLIAVGQAVEESLDVRSIALYALTALNEATCETAYLSVRDGQRAACIERIDGLYTRTAEMPIGGSLPLHQGAGPRAILSFMPETFRTRYVTMLEASQSNPISAQDARILTDRLVEIRDAGVSRSDGEDTPGVYSVAAPVLNHRAEVIGSITLSALKTGDIAAARSFDSLVRKRAEQVSTDLGFHSGRHQ